jgi:hypothetical protein
MHITLDNENKEKVLLVSQKLDKSCTWIINQILKSIEMENIELREELHIQMKNESNDTNENKKQIALKCE